ncbi:MAG: hypothetical protein QXL01_00805 [Thermoplasmatales archaeon]
MNYKELDVHIQWSVRFLRPQSKVQVAMFELFDQNPYSASLVLEKKIRIWPWDSAESLKNKIVRTQQYLLSKYISSRNLHEDIFEICCKLSESLTFVGKMRVPVVGGDVPPPPPLEKKKTPDSESINGQPRVLHIQDFLDKKKD